MFVPETDPVTPTATSMTQREFPTVPRVGVGAVVIDPAGHVLLVKRAREPMKGHWSLPGGLVELGETMGEAIQREVVEETNLTISAGPVIDVIDKIVLAETSNEPASNVRYHYIIVDFLCTVVSGDLQAATDADDACWITHDDWQPDGSNPYNLDGTAQRIIEKGWQIFAAR